jgi:hypothetical protein
MKHFPEALVATLIISIIAFAYILVQIFIEVIQSGLISPFIVGYILGVLTPIVIVVQIFKVGATQVDNSVLNTTMGKIRGML